MYRFIHRPPGGGFTLQEMLVTLAIVGTLAAGAVGIAGVVQENRLRSELSVLLAHLNLARSEAIKSRSPVTLCKSPDGEACTTSTGWREGWILFVDGNRNHERETDEPLLRAQEALTGDLDLRYGETGSYHYLTYKPDGSVWPQATFTFCDGRGAAKARAIIVFWTGRARVSTRRSDGKPLQCPSSA